MRDRGRKTSECAVTSTSDSTSDSSPHFFPHQRERTSVPFLELAFHIRSNFYRRHGETSQIS